MKKEPTIDALMAQLEEKLAWFQGEDFTLDQAKDRFIEARQLVVEIEKRLSNIENEIQLLQEADKATLQSDRT